MGWLEARPTVRGSGNGEALLRVGGGRVPRAPRHVDIAVVLDRDVTALHVLAEGELDRLREGLPRVGRAAERNLRPAVEADEPGPAGVDVAVEAPAGPVDLERGLVREDAVQGRRSLTDDDGPQVVLRVAPVRCARVGGHPHVAVLRVGPVEGDAAGEEPAVTVEGEQRIARLGLPAVQRRGHPLGRGVARVAGDLGRRPRLAAIGRVGEALPTAAEIVVAVVVPAGENEVRVGRVDRYRGLVALPERTAVVRVGVTVTRSVGRGARRGVRAVLDGTIGASVVPDVGGVRRHQVVCFGRRDRGLCR